MKYKSLYETNKIVSDAIEQGKLNKALQLVHDFVEAIITEPLCTAHINGSNKLDNLCQRIGEHNYLKLLEFLTLKPRLENQPPVFVYIATRLQKSGGHTRVIENFISSRPHARHIILLTGLSGRSDCDYTLGRLDSSVDVSFESALIGNFEKKLSWLQRRLIEIAPQQIYLFNHPQDSVAVAAVQPAMRFNASFYHHADHHLCLGVFLSHLEHIDIHSPGYHHCRDALGITNIYLPLVVEDKGARPPHALFKKN